MFTLMHGSGSKVAVGNGTSVAVAGVFAADKTEQDVNSYAVITDSKSAFYHFSPFPHSKSVFIAHPNQYKWVNNIKIFQYAR